MTLGFSTFIDVGQGAFKTFFPEKILLSLCNEGHKLQLLAYLSEQEQYDQRINVSQIDWCPPKDHTIRKDKNGAWKQGTPIHFVIGNRTKNLYQFAPVIPATAVQKITFKREKGSFPIITIRNLDGKLRKVLNPDKALNYMEEVDRIAIRDGLPSWNEFLAYFNEDDTYSIIHWTKNTY